MLQAQLAIRLPESLQYDRDCLDEELNHKAIHAPPSPPATPPKSENIDQPGLHDLLETAARTSPQNGILTYPSGKVSTVGPTRTSYARLYSQAKANAFVIQQIEGFRPGMPLLIHLDRHLDNILWFWSVVLSKALPVMSSPFSQDRDLRRKHIQGLCSLLENPICITRGTSMELFDCDHTLSLYTVESLEPTLPTTLATSTSSSADTKVPNDDNASDTHRPAFLMLTSGSTGNSKAVKITYKQIRAAIEGKASARQPPPNKPFLNWVGLDHVGSLAEIHLLALALGLDQIHVQPADVVSSPLTFLDLLSHHHVSRSFAPNFFLSKLLATVDSSKEGKTWDLGDLDFMVSGGEANDMETVVATSQLFSQLGARPDVLVPGFGMTETCAGSIYNTNCPESDIRHGRSVASLGKCVRGIEMRVMLDTGARSRRLAKVGETGDLEVRGDIIFEGYYRNEAATAEALSPDGWFRTGDQATIDDEGNLNLMGRVKDVLNIRGVKIPTADVQTTLEKALSGKVTYVICFPSRAVETHTEQVTVAYIPQYWPIRPEGAAAIHQSIVEASIVCTGSRPAVFGLRDQSQLPVSTLGKIPRSKMRSLFEKGVFDKDVKYHMEVLAQHRTNTVKLPPSQLEAALLGDVAEIIGADLAGIDIDTPVFDLGFNSLDLIRLKNRVDNRLATNIPLTTYLRSPTVRALASNLSSAYNISQTSDGVPATPSYDPVVPLLTKGSKTPLWLIHPGVGEILVFIGLSHHLADDDRPVYALRAPGFDPGQAPFESVEDAVKTYHEAITRHQPNGPYAIAGYSYGSMLAFEVSKRLESESGATVQFTGSFNLPPHIKQRMQQLNWNMCLLNLAHFLDLVPESYVDEIDEGFSGSSRDESLATVLSVVDKTRMLELGLDESALTSWTHVAYSLQSMAVDYDPSGSIDSMDVFHAIPLKIAAKSKEDWVNNHLSRWRDYTRGEVRFYEVEGSHYTMIGPNHVTGFAQTLKRALRERGL